MNKTTIASILVLLAGPALATFELKDPAADIYQDQEMMERIREEGPQVIGQTPCSEFIRQKSDKSNLYRVSLDWAVTYIEASGYRPAGSGRLEPNGLGLWLEYHCNDNGGDRLQQAANAFVEEFGP